jgi:VWFA-related protein
MFAVGWIGLGVAFGAAAIEPESEPTPTYFKPVQVPLVDVDVIVTDADGLPVADLTREDFEVLEDGEPMQISHFARKAVSPVATESADTAPFRPPSWSSLRQPDEQSYLVLYFDDSNTEPRRRASVLDHLELLVGDIQRAGVRTMVARFDGALHLESDFSDPPERVVEVLDGIRKRPAIDASREADELIREMESAAKQLPVFAAKAQPDGSSAPSPMVGMISDFGPRIEAYSQAVMARNQASLAALGQLVNVLRGVRGRKAVLWVGALDTRGGEELYGAWASLMPGRGGMRGAAGMVSSLRYDITVELTTLADVASGNMVSLYPVSSLGTDAASRASTESSTGLGAGGGTQVSGRDRWGSGDSRSTLSVLTGGRVVRDGRSLDSELARMAVELGSYYSIAYRPPAKSLEGFHSIEVNVKRDGATVRHRHGHQGLGGLARMVDRVVAAALTGVTDNALDVALDTEAQEPRDNGTTMVPVVIRIPLGELALIPASDSHTAQVSVFTLVRDDRGGLSELSERSYPLEIRNDDMAAAVGQSAEFVLGLVVRDGRHRVAVGVRDDRSLTASTVFIDVDTEETTGGTPG